MGLPNKQIGWSNESNLLWEVLRQVTILGKNINSGTINPGLQQVLNNGYYAESLNTKSNINFDLEGGTIYMNGYDSTENVTSFIGISGPYAVLSAINEFDSSTTDIRVRKPLAGQDNVIYYTPNDNITGNYTLATREYIAEKIIRDVFVYEATSENNFIVTLNIPQPDRDYTVLITPSNSLTAAGGTFFVRESGKNTSDFAVEFSFPMTGEVSFDYVVVRN